ncbi:hypothetical protein AB0I10_33785 [Streptomyces sp. NPDC050636]|uniref:alpha/beta fold hydrolase n=1 Tax=Streptomyces sp. NPDC050636 TaxID=3154510 RepID=UPI003434D321
MQPRVIYVHGNGNKVRPELLKSQWDTALFGRDMGESSRMAYWASLRYEKPLPDFRPDPLDGGPVGVEEAVASTGLPVSEEMPAPAEFEAPEQFVAKTLGEAQFDAGGVAAESLPGPAVEEALAGWLRDMVYLADTLSDSEEHEVDGGSTGGAGEFTETGAGDQLPLETLPLPRSARSAVFRLLVKHTFKDVHAYFFGGAGPAIRDVVKESLEGLDGAPVVVVGHSLGTIVAYEVLAEQGRDVELLVTVGSPLAITEVQDHLARPPAVPTGVLAWRNASDLRDLVALDHTLRPEYAPQDRVTDLLVSNDSRNHHGITQYLSNQQVREPVQQIFHRLA